MPEPDVQSLIERASAEMQAGRATAAERLYRDVLARDPEHAVALHFLGLCLVQTGRASEGLAYLARSITLLPGKAKPRHNYGVALLQAGDLAAAERELLEAIRLEPENAASHHYLGMVRQRLGRLAEAAIAYHAALERAPDDPAVTSNLGFCLLEQGDVEGAQAWLRRSIAREPRNAVAHNNLGSALSAGGDAAGAIASFRSAVELAPTYALAWYNLALALRRTGDYDGAFGALRSAVQHGPDFAPAWQALADELAHAEFDAWDPRAAEDFTQILRHPAVDAAPLARAAAALLVLDPAFGPAFRGLVSGGAPAGVWSDAARLQALAHPLLLALIEDAVVPDPEFELFLRALRRGALESWQAGTLQGSPPAVGLLCALAQQCFLDEYVWPESADEAAVVERLVARVGAGASAAEVALLAACRPIAAYRGMRRPFDAGAAFARMWRRQVEEPSEEARLRPEIPVIGTIEDATSRAVQAQYERNPYPRWHRLPQTHVGAYPLGRALRALFPHVDPGRLRVPEAPRILAAGCGSGFQVAVTASRNRSGQVLAVDLSRTSLAYAMRRCRELGLANVRFAQADILALGSLGERFDWIECGGVLHHMRDPLAGWRVLCTLLAPGGVMKVALYSEIARRGVVAARELVAREGLVPDLAGIRAARQLILAQPIGSAAREALLAADFWTASGARDLVMHVEEHRYTTTELATMIDALGLEFLGFEFDVPETPNQYRVEHLDDPGGRSLANWGAFEARRPHAFARMYQFWVRKPD